MKNPLTHYPPWPTMLGLIVVVVSAKLLAREFPEPALVISVVAIMGMGIAIGLLLYVLKR